jgi:hypothetical protein
MKSAQLWGFAFAPFGQGCCVHTIRKIGPIPLSLKQSSYYRYGPVLPKKVLRSLAALVTAMLTGYTRIRGRHLTRSSTGSFGIPSNGLNWSAWSKRTSGRISKPANGFETGALIFTPLLPRSPRRPNSLKPPDSDLELRRPAARSTGLKKEDKLRDQMMRLTCFKKTGYLYQMCRVSPAIFPV